MGINSMTKKIMGFIVGLSLLLSISACGGMDTASQDMYNQALVATYSIYTPSQTMNNLMVSVFYTAFADLITSLQTPLINYYSTHSSTLPGSINLTDSQWSTYVPSGITGTVYFTPSGAASWNLTNSNLIFNGYNAGGYTLQGTVRLTSGVITYTSTFSATNLTFNASTFNATTGMAGGTSASYSGFTVNTDNPVAPTSYTFNGSVTFASAMGGSNMGYSFSSLTYSKSSSSLSISGTLSFGGDEYQTTGSVTVTGSAWTGGTLTFTIVNNNPVTASLSGTTASFTQEGSDSWTLEDWMNSNLAP